MHTHGFPKPKLKSIMLHEAVFTSTYKHTRAHATYMYDIHTIYTVESSTYCRLFGLVYKVLERVVLVRLKGGEDQIENKIFVASRSLLDLLRFLVFRMVSDRFKHLRCAVDLSRLKLGLTGLFNLIPAR